MLLSCSQSCAHSLHCPHPCPQEQVTKAGEGTAHTSNEIRVAIGTALLIINEWLVQIPFFSK